MSASRNHFSDLNRAFFDGMKQNKINQRRKYQSGLHILRILFLEVLFESTICIHTHRQVR